MHCLNAVQIASIILARLKIGSQGWGGAWVRLLEEWGNHNNCVMLLTNENRTRVVGDFEKGVDLRNIPHDQSLE